MTDGWRDGENAVVLCVRRGVPRAKVDGIALIQCGAPKTCKTPLLQDVVRIFEGERSFVPRKFIKTKS